MTLAHRPQSAGKGHMGDVNEKENFRSYHDLRRLFSAMAEVEVEVGGFGEFCNHLKTVKFHRNFSKKKFI